MNRAVFLNQAKMNDSTNNQDEAKQRHESPAIILDSDNQPIANVTARLWPKLHCGGFCQQTFAIFKSVQPPCERRKVSISNYCAYICARVTMLLLTKFISSLILSLFDSCNKGVCTQDIATQRRRRG